MRDLAYLKLLAKEYPSLKAASSEIINLIAICGLPKGTEYFFSDLHGEYEAFIYLLRSASGIIREKIRVTYGYIIPEEEQVELANLIYYPDRNLNKIIQEGRGTEDWQRITVNRLVQICKEVSSKYTRSKVRKKMPREFGYVIDELLHVDYNDENKRVYYEEIIRSIIDTGIADKFIVALCELIQDGSGNRKSCLCMQCSPDRHQLQQLRCSGGWIRHQSSSSVHVCFKGIQGRSLQPVYTENS